jgi:hypothetical protein
VVVQRVGSGCSEGWQGCWCCPDQQQCGNYYGCHNAGAFGCSRNTRWCPDDYRKGGKFYDGGKFERVLDQYLYGGKLKKGGDFRMATTPVPTSQEDIKQALINDIFKLQNKK